MITTFCGAQHHGNEEAATIIVQLPISSMNISCPSPKRLVDKAWCDKSCQILLKNILRKSPVSRLKRLKPAHLCHFTLTFTRQRTRVGLIAQWQIHLVSAWGPIKASEISHTRIKQLPSTSFGIQTTWMCHYILHNFPSQPQSFQLSALEQKLSISRCVHTSWAHQPQWVSVWGYDHRLTSNSGCWLNKLRKKTNE